MKKISVVIKILLSLVLIADLILNIFLFKNVRDIKQDVYNIKWDVSTIDSSVYSIKNDIEKIIDDVDDIKHNVNNIEWDLDHYY